MFYAPHCVLLSSSYLPQTAFLLHVFLHVVPDAALGEKAAPRHLLEDLKAAVALQDQLHDVHRLQELTALIRLLS